ncbi:MAG TPA: ubiquinol-cytochrome c reductase cytochrome b subunit, partial [Acidimicrobiia bacterium]|nr:ubiquinol-cytochrome c reductase cytochrome b subunit [Acidimicrobiia bacterium]
EVRAFGFEIPNPFFPGALLGGLTFGLLYAWPALEAFVTRDHAEHHLCERPRQRPLRTAMGVATLSFYTVCLLGGAADVIAATLGLSVNAVLESFRVAVFVVPFASGWVTFRLCQELAARDGLPVQPARARGIRRGGGSGGRNRPPTSRRARRRAPSTADPGSDR